MSLRIARRGSIAASRAAGAPPSGNVLYLSMDGTAGNYASTPDSAATSITGDIDVRAKVNLADWTPTATKYLIVKGSADPVFSYQFAVLGGGITGRLYLLTSPSGTLASIREAISSVATGVTDGTTKWVRAARVSSSGVVTFYTSDDGSSWTQLGTTQNPGSGAIFNGTQDVVVGASNSGSGSVSGGIYYADIRSTIDGSPVAVFDPTTVTRTAVRTPTSLVASTGETWTMSGSTWDWVT